MTGIILPQGAIFSLRTPHYPKMLAFYAHLLGEPKRRKEDAWAFFNLSGADLVLWADADHTPGRGSLQLTIFVSDLAALAERSDLKLSPIQEASHGIEAMLDDPDGNELILYQPNR